MNKALPLPIKKINGRQLLVPKYRKPLCLLVIAYFMHIIVFGANKSATGSGAWSSNSNVWSGNGNAPAAGDNVTIGSGISITVDITTAQCAKITLNGGTLIISSGNMLTMTGDLVASGASALTINGTGTLAIGGVLAATNLTATLNTASTVNFNAAAAQTIPAYSYGNLKLAGSGLKTISNGASVNNIELNGGTLTLPAANTLSISGSLPANGSPAPSLAGFVSFTGSGTQVIPAYTYGTLNIDKTANKTLGGDVIATNVTFSGSGAGTLAVAAGQVLTVTGSLGDGNINFDPASILVLSGTNAQIIPVYTYGTVNIAGTSSKSLAGDVVVNKITFGGTGSLVVGSNEALTINESLASGNIVLEANSIINFNGTSPQTIPALNYSTLTIAGTGDKILSGDLAVTNIAFSGSGALVVGSGQTLSVSGTIGAGNLNLDAASTLNFNGTTAQAIPGYTYGNIKINNAAGVTLGMPLTTSNLKGNLLVESGTLNSGGFDIFGSTGQAFQVNNGATLVLSVASIFPAGFSTVSLQPTSTVNFSGTSTQTIPNYTFGNIKINNSSNALFAMNVTSSNVLGGITVESGTLSLDNTITVSGAPITVYNNATLAVAGTFPASTVTLQPTSTVNFNGTSAQTIPNKIYGNIRINNPAGATLGAALTTTNLKGSLTIQSGTFDNGGFGITATSGKTLLVNNGATLVLSGITTFPTSFSTVTLQPASTINFKGFGAQTIPNYTYGYIKINNTSSSGATLGMSVTAANVLGDITVESGTLSVGSSTTITGVPLTVKDNATMSVAGDFSTFVVNLEPYSTINFNGSSAQVIPNYAYTNIKVNNTSLSGATLGMNVTSSNVTGNITVERGTLNIGSTTTISGAPVYVSNSGTLAVSGEFPASAVTLQVASTLNFNGASQQNVPSRSYGLLQFTGTGPKVLEGNITAGNTMVAAPIDLSNGGIDIGGNTLTLSATGTISEASSTNYIKLSGGKMIVQGLGTGSRTGEWLFPVGTTSTYTPAYITNSGAVNDFSVNVIDGINDQYNNLITSHVVNKTWNVSRETSNGAVDVTLKLQWNAADEAYDPIDPTQSFNRNTSAINHFEGGKWNKLVTTPVAGDGTSYFVSASGINTFSPFGVSDTPNPLPVELVYLNVTNKKGLANLEWLTATEKENKGFEIQGSQDGRSFEAVGFVESKMPNSTQAQQYEFTDLKAKSGVWYYRLKQEDLGGDVTYSEVKSLDFGKPTEGIKVFPNPFADELTISLQTGANTETTIELRDVTGKAVLSETQNLSSGLNTVALKVNPTQPAGIYYLAIRTASGVYTSKILKR